MVLSCRVFGREIEDAVLARLLADAAAAGAQAVLSTVVPTPRNARCADVLARAGFGPDPARGVTAGRHTLEHIAPIPEWITFPSKECFHVA